MTIEAGRNIEKDEELTLDYFEITQIPLGIKCKCSPDCKTTI